MVQRMGFGWNDHYIEQGIDGVIELTKPEFNEALGKFVGAQIKTQKQFASETQTEFSFYADSLALAYWSTCNVPLVLLVCNPAAHQYFSLHLQTYLAKQAN